MDKDVVRQWIDDLDDTGIAICNPNYEFYVEDDGTIVGDHALFLVYRHAQLDEDTEDDVVALTRWYDQHCDEIYEFCSRVTGIPLEDMTKIIDAPSYYAFDLVPQKTMTKAHVIWMLREYLNTGEVKYAD